MRLTAEMLARSPAFLNALRDRELDLRGNKIAVIENLAATQDQFDSIDLSDNEIKKVECMAVLKRLTQLLLNNNRVSRIDPGLGRALPKLQTLVLTNNQLTTLTELEPLAHAPTITSLALVDNPVTKAKDYRAFVIALLPRLKVLDYKRVKPAERAAAEAAFRSSRKPAPLKGPSGGAAGGGEVLAVEQTNGGGAATAVRAAPTEAQVAQIRVAISAASSLEEVQKLEAALRAGNYELIAKAAEAAEAANGGDAGDAEGAAAEG